MLVYDTDNPASWNDSHEPHSTLGGGLSASATSLTVADGSSFPAPNFQGVIEGEFIGVGTRSGNTLSNLTRGPGGSAAAVAVPNTFGLGRLFFDNSPFGPRDANGVIHPLNDFRLTGLWAWARPRRPPTPTATAASAGRPTRRPAC